MLMLLFIFNTVKLGSRTSFYNTIHLRKSIKLAITGLGKVTKVFQICVQCGLIRRCKVNTSQYITFLNFVCADRGCSVH